MRRATLQAQLRALTTPDPTPTPDTQDLSAWAPAVLASTNTELAELLDLLNVTLGMQADGTVRVLHATAPPGD